MLGRAYCADKTGDKALYEISAHYVCNSEAGPLRRQRRQSAAGIGSVARTIPFLSGRWPAPSTGPRALVGGPHAPVDHLHGSRETGEILGQWLSVEIQASAQLRVGDHTHSLTTAESDRAAVFRLTLQAGRAEIEGSFKDTAGNHLSSAFLITVKPLPSVIVPTGRRPPAPRSR